MLLSAVMWDRRLAWRWPSRSPCVSGSAHFQCGGPLGTLCFLVAAFLCACGGISRSGSTDAGITDYAGGGEESDAASGARSGNGSGGAGTTSSGGTAAADELPIDPDGVCSPPCGVMLVEPQPGALTPSPGALLATIFYEIETSGFELRAGTDTPEAGEEVVMLFTWETNHYGYSEWARNYWTFLSLDPDVTDSGGFSRPEGVEFTAVLENSMLAVQVRIRFSFVYRGVLVREAARER